MATPQFSPLILPLVYQSQDISFSQWVTLLTLCLAPLIAHIIAGAPRSFYLCKHRPRWHERLVHYNPTSVLWRYAAIADRRIRARDWDRVDIAAANAIFWTSKGWDGSETMVDHSLVYCTHLPSHSRVSLLSGDMIKTWIVTLQGVNTVIVLIRGLGNADSSSSFVILMGVDFIFYPLAFIGLLRLTSALWLTEDFNYTMRHSSELLQYPTDGIYISRQSVDSLLDDTNRPELLGNRYRSTSTWSSRAFRSVYLVPLLGMLAICTRFIANVFIVVDGYGGVITTSTFLLAIFYTAFLTATTGICVFYFVKGSTSTVVPCITATWYKAYTLLVMAMALTVLVISCLETRETPCGKFTSAPGVGGDYGACYSSSVPNVISFNQNRTEPGSFGLATTIPLTRLERAGTLESGQFWVLNFTGTCLGDIEWPDVTLAGTIKTVVASM